MASSSTSSPLTARETLKMLRDSLLKLQKHVTKQEGTILELKKQVALRVTRPDVEVALSLKLSPTQLEEMADKTRRQLNEKIETKVDKSALAMLLRSKVDRSDIRVCNNSSRFRQLL